MALQKSIELPSGAVVSYHKVQGLVLRRGESNVAEVQLDSYVSKEAREAGKRPLVSKSVSLSSLDLSQSILEELYLKLKLLPELEGAEDA